MILRLDMADHDSDHDDGNYFQRFDNDENCSNLDCNVHTTSSYSSSSVDKSTTEDVDVLEEQKR